MIATWYALVTRIGLRGVREEMGTGNGRNWGRSIGIGVLILFSPVLLVAAWAVLVTTPIEVAAGLEQHPTEPNRFSRIKLLFYQ